MAARTTPTRTHFKTQTTVAASTPTACIRTSPEPVAARHDTIDSTAVAIVVGVIPTVEGMEGLSRTIGGARRGGDADGGGKNVVKEEERHH